MKTISVVLLAVSCLCACSGSVERPDPAEGDAGTGARDSSGDAGTGAGESGGGGGDAGTGAGESGGGDAGGGGSGDGGGDAGGGGSGGGGGADVCPGEPVFPVCYEPCDCELTAKELNDACLTQKSPLLGHAVACAVAPDPGPETGYKECAPLKKTLPCGGTDLEVYCCQP